MKYKFAFISEEMDSEAYQCRLIHEGHEVKTWIKLPEERETGKGIIPTVKSWESLISWADYFILDSNCFGKEGNILRKMKKKVFGGTPNTDRTESERSFGFKLLESYGINCGVWAGPFKAEEAISFIRQNTNRWVIKPDGSLDKDLTFVSKDAEDALEFLTEHKSEYKGMLILQQFVDGAKELAIGITVQHGNILFPARENVEHKNLFNGNLGVATGEQGTIVHYTNNSPLLDEILKLSPWFEKENYTGDFDLNFMIQDDGSPICLETTARPGYPISILQCDNIAMPYGKYLSSLIDNKLDAIPIYGSWTCGVVLSAPGFPFKESYHKHGRDRHIEQLNDIYEPGLYFYAINKDKKGFVTTGNYGAVLVAVANTDSLESCTEDCYEFIKDYDLPRWLAYRTDIGKDLFDKDLAWFNQRGYLKE